jgi:hypothetical protein
MALPIAAMSLHTLELVSTWTARMALIAPPLSECRREAVGERDQRLRVDFDRRPVHCLQHFVGDVGRPRHR